MNTRLLEIDLLVTKKNRVAHIKDKIGRIFKADRELTDSILQVSVEANRQIVEELMGDENMCEALMEIMESQLLKKERRKIRRAERSDPACSRGVP